VLVGAGGYGKTYIDMLTNGGVSDYAVLSAIVDPYFNNTCSIPIYKSLIEYYSENDSDLCIISTPIYLHYEQCVTAMQNNSHVLCEKPLVPNMEQYNHLHDTVKQSGRILSVGFQWCYSNVMLGLKERILCGHYGRPISAKCFVSWQRDWEYYARPWAGKITFDGKTCNDSIISNATAHYIQNILFLLGSGMESSADVTDINAECYRANAIESFDTIMLNCKAQNTNIFYAASHAVNYNVNPITVLTFEKAVIHINMFGQNNECVIHHTDGTVEHLGDALSDGGTDRLINTVKRIWGEDTYICTIDTVKPFTKLINHIFNECKVMEYPTNRVVTDEINKRTYVKNLHVELYDMFNKY
jgi:predicted dehydrogenase